MSYPPNQPPPGPGWGGQDQGGWAPQPGPDQGGWAPQPGADQGWAPGPGQAPPGPQQQWAQPGYGTPPPGMPGGPPAPKKSSPVLPIAIIVVLIAAAIGAFVVFSGGDDDGGSPESAATNYVEALIDRDCSAMADLVNLEGQGTSADQIVSECEEAVQDSDAASEFLPTELVSTRVVSEDGDAATVAAEVRLGSGDTTTQDLDMSRIDGDWRVNVDPFGDEGPDDTTPTTEEPDDTTSTTEDEPDDTTTTTESTTTTVEGDPEDLANRDACAGGDMAACDDLWLGTPVGSELEAFAETCGGLAPEGGYENTCESTFG